MRDFSLANTRISAIDRHVRLLTQCGGREFECCISRNALEALEGAPVRSHHGGIEAARRHFPAIAAAWQAALNLPRPIWEACVWLDVEDFATPPLARPSAPDEAPPE